MEKIYKRVKITFTIVTIICSILLGGYFIIHKYFTIPCDNIAVYDCNTDFLDVINYTMFPNERSFFDTEKVSKYFNSKLKCGTYELTAVNLDNENYTKKIKVKVKGYQKPLLLIENDITDVSSYMDNVKIAYDYYEGEITENETVSLKQLNDIKENSKKAKKELEERFISFDENGEMKIKNDVKTDVKNNMIYFAKEVKQDKTLIHVLVVDSNFNNVYTTFEMK